jgi:lipoprotein-releasing system permease protein
MYKLLICWRYLRTRYIALASIVSVTLGVATMIVVNSVMEGFGREMQGRIHGILSDVAVASHSADGFLDPQAHIERIRRVAGKYIKATSPTVSIPAMLAFEYQGTWHQRQVTLIGIEPATYGEIGDFRRYLQHPENRRAAKFELREGGYDTVDRERADARPRRRMEIAGWMNRRMWAQFEKDLQPPEETTAEGADAQAGPPPAEVEYQGWVFERGEPATPGEREKLAAVDEGADFDPATQTHTGIVLGMALAYNRMRDGSDHFFMLPGDDVKIVVPTAGTPPRDASDTFTIVDFYESKLSEYDTSYVFVPLEKLQTMRRMVDARGIGYATSIQIKLRDEADGDTVRDLLRKEFPADEYAVQTWRDAQGPLLAAVNLETTILNLLLFLIIAVAGFGILAIFYMIVVEKTKDIGILKSLGAPRGGVQGIFLAYGLGLGLVGAGGGMVLGLTIVANINQIADALAAVTGQQVFDPTVFYFQEIPAVVKPFTVGWIVIGAMLIAVLASILPARRAAGLHPVEALRHE